MTGKTVCESVGLETHKKDLMVPGILILPCNEDFSAGLT